MSDARPIGVFDSGVGGLTVAAALARALPGESILYLGDTARLPYGTKSEQTVARYTRTNVDFLVGRGVKAVVVACNTASALALPHLAPSLPVWGVIEPGARRAAQVSAGRVGVIATESTVHSGAYERALRAQRADLDVRSQACPLLVPLVEEGWFDDPITVEVLSRYLAPLLAAAIDTLVLGCTHYPLLVPALRRVVGERIALVDSAEAVAADVARDLERLGLRSEHREGADHVCVTDSAERFTRLAREILHRPVRLELVDLGDGGGGER
ncbi:MAG: glutamate racemase [Thermoanaerobaculia bacterium]|nr:MAG: glutamate racemase [Thermoanaerobaculia bacterium]